MDVFIRRVILAGFCDKSVRVMSDLVEDADNAFFKRVTTDKHRVPYHLFMIVKLYLSTI